jgi:hypothetical protein
MQSAAMRVWNTAEASSTEEVVAEVAKDIQALATLADREWQRHNADDSLDANAFANLSAVHQGPLHATPLHDQGEDGCLQDF